MSKYNLIWITNQLAVGHAPMSYGELRVIRDQGIDGIVNLCGEFCDLHQIQKDFGFEVYYIPVQDNEAPPLEEVEKALQWLDEAIYLGKKILVHCRLGIGRTGTFVTSYLLRRGFTMKLARKQLKKTRTESTSFNQWQFLRRFGRKEGRLTIRSPSLERNRLVNLTPYFEDYEALVAEAEARFKAAAGGDADPPRCGRENDACCHRLIKLELIEAAYLSHYMNKNISMEGRLKAIKRAIKINQITYKETSAGRRQVSSPSDGEIAGEDRQGPTSEVRDYKCPLSVQGKCIVFVFRPVACRLHDMNGAVPFSRRLLEQGINDLSRRLFLELNSALMEGALLFSLANVVSGRFVQEYFHFISK